MAEHPPHVNFLLTASLNLPKADELAFYLSVPPRGKRCGRSFEKNGTSFDSLGQRRHRAAKLNEILP